MLASWPGARVHGHVTLLEPAGADTLCLFSLVTCGTRDVQPTNRLLAFASLDELRRMFRTRKTLQLQKNRTFRDVRTSP